MRSFLLIVALAVLTSSCCGRRSNSTGSGASQPPATKIPGGTTAPPVQPQGRAPAPPGPLPGVEVSEDVKQYSIQGRTASELRAQMNQLGPVDRDGRHDARTDWYVRWSYPFARGSAGCSTGPVKVTLQVTYTYPVWAPPAGAANDLVRKWNAYRTSLENHERGHADNGRQAAREVADALSKLPPSGTCPAMDAAANARGNAILDRWRAADISYDSSTKHGRTQGAVFP